MFRLSLRIVLKERHDGLEKTLLEDKSCKLFCIYYTYVYEIAPQGSYLFSTIFFGQQVSIVLTIATSIERFPSIYVLVSEGIEILT